MTVTKPSTTPAKIVDVAIGFMSAKQLFAASRIGLFKALSDGEKVAAEIAEATKVTEQTARVLADAMNSLGLLDRNGGRYALTVDTREYLSGDGELDLSPFLHFLNSVSYGHFEEFYDTTVDTTTPGKLDLDEAGWGVFMNGVMTYNALHAKMFARQVDFTKHENILDFGGLSTDFALNGLKENPNLKVTFVYDEGFTDAIQPAMDEAGVGERVTVVPAATDTAKPEGEFDAVMLNHVAHRFNEEQNKDILAAARAAAANGATLYMLDFYLDDDERQRPIDALHAGEYFNIDGTVVYPESQVRDWLTDAGWRVDEVLSLPGSPRVLVATAV